MKSVKQSLFFVLSLLLSTGAFTQNLTDVSIGGNFQMYGFTTPGVCNGYNYPFRINDGCTDGGRFIVTTDGNVGLGCSYNDLPTSKLHVKNGLFTVEQNSVKVTTGVFTTQGTTTDHYGYIGTSNNNPFAIGANNNQAIYISEDNKVGIGISDPTEKLHLNGNFRMGAGGVFDVDNGTLAGGRLRITPDGNVGININSPLEKLHLNGNFRMGSDYTVAMDAPGVVGGRFFINAAGNVGIGTNSPVEKLHIKNGNFRMGVNGTFEIDSANSTGTITAGGRLRITSTGSIGIGTTNPAEKLHLNGNFRMGGDYTFGVDAVGTVGGRFFVNADGNVGIGVNPATALTAKLAIGIGKDGDNVPIYAHINETSGSNGVYIGTSSNHLVALGTNGTSRIVITKDGKVGIGTSIPGTYQLAVEGGIGARSVEVKAGQWADFVFDKNYRLRPLKEVEDSININKHLPDVPSEVQVKRDGINVAKMDAILLQKIEELTLYVIEQHKRIEAIEKENTRLKKKANR